MEIKAKRTADKEIYLNLGIESYKNPKEIFKFIAGKIAEEGRKSASVIDVGCASGVLLYHLQERFPDFKLAGMDIIPELVGKAQEMVPSARLITGDITNPDTLAREYDILISSGLFMLQDDPAPALTNMLAAVNKGGSIYIFDGFNRHPIDLFTRYRRAYLPDTDSWESGWNLWSHATCEKIMHSLGYSLQINWTEHKMPFPLAKREDDPMRTWTIETENNPRQRMAGTNMLIDCFLLQIRLDQLP